MNIDMSTLTAIGLTLVVMRIATIGAPLRITRRQCLATLLLSAAVCGVLFALKHGSALR